MKARARFGSAFAFAVGDARSRCLLEDEGLRARAAVVRRAVVQQWVVGTRPAVETPPAAVGSGRSSSNRRARRDDRRHLERRRSDDRRPAPVTPLPPAACEAAPDGGSEAVAEPTLVATLKDRWHEAWLASPAVADLDSDGISEIIVARDELLQIWHLDGELVRSLEVEGRIWASPVVADLRPELEGLEVAVAARGRIYAWDAGGTALPGFPFAWRDEMRPLAAADIDGDGSLELSAVTTSDLEADGQTDILIAIHSDGTVVDGFPPNTTGAAGCDDACYVHAGYDQNLALGDLDDDGVADLLAPQDNAYVSLPTVPGARSTPRESSATRPSSRASGSCSTTPRRSRATPSSSRSPSARFWS